MSDTKLLPCPFCGNTKPLLRNVAYDKTLWIISCVKCKVELTVPRNFKKKRVAGDMGFRRLSNRDDLVKLWNTRTKPKAHWELMDDGRYRCSECGWYHDIPDYTSPHCPRCRAEMVNHHE